jgi:hypothetical protein
MRRKTGFKVSSEWARGVRIQPDPRPPAQDSIYYSTYGNSMCGADGTGFRPIVITQVINRNQTKQAQDNINLSIYCSTMVMLLKLLSRQPRALAYVAFFVASRVGDSGRVESRPRRYGSQFVGRAARRPPPAIRSKCVGFSGTSHQSVPDVMAARFLRPRFPPLRSFSFCSFCRYRFTSSRSHCSCVRSVAHGQVLQ